MKNICIQTRKINQIIHRRTAVCKDFLNITWSFEGGLTFTVTLFPIPKNRHWKL